MGYDHPVVLRTVSDPVNLRFLDLLSANIDDPTVNDFLTTVQDDDLRRIMEAGFAASLNPPDDVLNSIVPSNSAAPTCRSPWCCQVGSSPNPAMTAFR